MDTTLGETPSRGLRDIVKDLQNEFVGLVKGEIALARAEFGAKTDTYKKSSVSAIIGGIVAYTGVLLAMAGLAFLVYRLFIGMGMASTTAMWFAPLVFGAVVAIIGGVMLKSALNKLKQESIMPERTIDSLKEDKQWARKKVA